MTPPLRTLAACVALAVPALASGQVAPMLRPGIATPGPATRAAAQLPDGQMRYALGAGASYTSATGASAASLNLGAESAVATADSRWRFGGKALWSRTAGETSADDVKLMLTQESLHRWSGSTWLREKLSVLPGLRANEGLRTTLETGVAFATSPFCKVTVGMLRSYERADPLFVTAIDLKLP